ncbi:probable aspartyl protease At4g16563 [Juglans microcarpa x Juglans regia]|uniref:probable aspartyl protease At4g16563 n=1 Tax=Juglans microcarpa x Juglans regia TaxID=2249226 RepID=UPI001B7E01F1|nr:probable aspartyl protease At4g16563 [Juglans microcarpa x Juglans regia]
MAASSLLSLIFVFSLSISVSSSSSVAPSPETTTLTIPLSPFSSKNPSSDPIKTLNSLASASLSRAHHLKRSKPNTPLAKTHVLPHSYGGYSISLSFGTPPQTITFVLDTGSSLVWFPCTSRYLCSNCDFPNIYPEKIPKFIPKLSSSSKILGCKNPKCTWIAGSDVQSRCQDCNPASQNCSQSCPPYIIQYGSGSTVGLLLSETLDFSKKTFPHFLVGCSIFSTRQPAGIAGFGRGPESLPSQLGVSKFSYCLLSRRFDDTTESSDLVLYSGSSSAKTPGLSYTPFRKNPVTNNTAYREFYYVTLRKVMVGDKTAKIQYKYLVPGTDGHGGTIVDSGSTFTFMERPVFEAVAKEFEIQMANYSRAVDIEARSGLEPCFNIFNQKTVNLPELTFQFKGGAKLILPAVNYFALAGNLSVVCLTIVTDNSSGLGSTGGPAIIFGSFQQQNFYVEYDLENERLGFRQQNCKN